MDAKDFMKQDAPLLPPGQGLSAMTHMQTSLVTEYVKIEKFNSPPWDMRLKQNQIDAKGFIFRVIEELAEAYESLLAGDIINFHTELADATHFLLELGIVTGHHMPQELWDYIWTKPTYTKLYREAVVQDWFWDVSFKLGLVSNAMRNKQWKQTEVLPDMGKFKMLMDEAYESFFTGFHRMGMTEHDVYLWYWRKNQVNHFRIKSKY